MSLKWDGRFIKLAEFVATWSKDPSTKCGAVITRGNQIVSLGYNGFPAGTDDDPEIYADRERKYKRVLHAEQNALMFANEDLNFCTCYVWPMPPCSRCAAMLVQSGISRVVSAIPDTDTAQRWEAEWEEAFEMFHEAGVKFSYL